ncbi:hypothetical protein F4779DRAFT_536810 [Xylariaceae sp. FL0662B]|nr:hypothetical protein F4779DRAFT_536810 [Xylariaceae sp. FL0662B]
MPSSSFESSQNDAQNTFNKTATAISIGWIVGIVVLVLSAIVAAVLCVYVYRRNRRRRRERMAQLEPKPNEAAYGHPAQQYGLAQSVSSPSTAYTPLPNHDTSLQTYYEAPNTSVGPREAPDNEVPRKSGAQEQPRYEMSGKDAGSELPV